MSLVLHIVKGFHASVSGAFVHGRKDPHVGTSSPNVVDGREKDSPERSASLAIKLKIYFLYSDTECVREGGNLKCKSQ